jgi:hypothetical protein
MVAEVIPLILDGAPLYHKRERIAVPLDRHPGFPRLT